MTDGAHLNVGAANAMKTILGGDEPEPMTDEEFEAMIREAPLSPGMWDYGAYANATARIVLEAYERWPQLQEMADTHVYLSDSNGFADWNVNGIGSAVVLNRTLYDVIKQIYPEHYEAIFIELSGFQWGWAVNAARKILDLGPLPNPAIVTIGVGRE